MIKEVKRRADVVGILPKEGAIIRLVGAILLEQNDEWAVQRRYMTLETSNAVQHNDHVIALQADRLTKQPALLGSTAPTPR